MFKNILFPVDLTENTNRILPFVLDAARKFEARLHIIYVAPDLRYYGGFSVPVPAIETFSDELRKGAEKKMKDFVDAHFYDLKGVERHIRVGDPAEDLLEFAVENGIDLIIMGTHGRKGLDRVIFGSVAENVTRNSPIPVMVINPHRLDMEALSQN